MSIHRLTATQLAARLRAGKDGRYGDGGNLYLQIKNGTPSWLFRYSFGGRPRAMGLGGVNTVDVETARAKAAEARRILKVDKRDPMVVRDQAEELDLKTFDECAAEFFAGFRKGLRNIKHRDQWESTLRIYASPYIGLIPVRDIDSKAVLRVLRPIWETKPETARRVRGRMEQVIGFAIYSGYRQDPINPAKWQGYLDKAGLPEMRKIKPVKGHASLPYAELPGFIQQLREQSGLGARALEFLILAACRTGDVIGAAEGPVEFKDRKPPLLWAHIDFEREVWIIPSTKSHDEPHLVPLGKRALQILEEARPYRTKSDIVFPSLDKVGHTLSNNAMTSVLDRMKYRLTVHGFRATFKTWAEENTDAKERVIEAVLAHGKVSDKLRRAYMRGDFFEQRRELMAAWEKHVCSAESRPRLSVVPK